MYFFSRQTMSIELIVESRLVMPKHCFFWKCNITEKHQVVNILVIYFFYKADDTALPIRRSTNV
jgi:hypothetical protein